MKNAAAALFLTLSLAAFPAWGAHPLITDDTGTQGAGKYQVEINGGIGHERQSSGDKAFTESCAEGTAAFTAGVSETVDVVASIPFVWSRTAVNGAKLSNDAGLSDTSLEVKWRFLELGPVSFAVKPGISFPAGNEARGLGNGRISYGADLISSIKCNPVTFHINLAYGRNEFRLQSDRDILRRNILHASLAATTEVAKGVQLVGDIGAGSNPEKRDTTWPAYALAGVIWSLNDSIDLDAGVKAGITRPETDIEGLAGITLHF